MIASARSRTMASIYLKPSHTLDNMRLDGDPEAPAATLYLFNECLAERISRINENARALGRWHHFAHQFKYFGSQLGCRARKPCNVAAWVRKAGNKPRPNRIGHRRHNDWQRGRRISCRKRRRRQPNDDQIDIKPDQPLARSGGLASRCHCETRIEYSCHRDSPVRADFHASEPRTARGRR